MFYITLNVYTFGTLEFTILLLIDGEEIRTTKGDFGESNVHDQSGISFRTPPYPDPNITESVKVCLNFQGFYFITKFNQGLLKFCGLILYVIIEGIHLSASALQERTK